MVTPRAAPAHPEGWQIGRLIGVPVVLARSWFVVAAAVTFLFGPVVARANPDLGTGAYVVAFGYAVLLMLSVLVHELAHAVMARATGLPATRIVLNLWGGHTQFEAESSSPARSFGVAVVGPLANGAIAVAAWLALPVIAPTGVAYLLVSALALTNAFVALFNLVPGLPLDGGRMLEAVVWRFSGDRSTGTLVGGWAGRVVAVALVGWFVLRPLLLGMQPDLISVIWVAMIGALLWQGATQAIRHSGVRRRLSVASVASLITPAVGVPMQVSVEHALQRASASGVRDVVLLDPDGAPAGVLDAAAVAAVPVARHALVPAASAARAMPPGAVIDVRLVGQPVLAALSALPGEEFAAVDQDGRVVGVLRAADVVAAVLPRRGA